MTPGPGKDRRWILLLIPLIILGAGVGWIIFLFGHGARESEGHDYQYSITLSYTTTIENATFLLPVPEMNGTSLLADMLVNGNGYGVPADWNLSLETVNGTPLLAIRAARMVPDYHEPPIPLEPGESPAGTPLLTATEYSEETPVLIPKTIGATLRTDVPVDTRNPLAREPVFFPGGQFTPRPKTTPPYEGVESIHPVRLYVSYTADHPVSVSLVARVSGTNSIWRGGWTFNTYEDLVIVEAGNRTGWLEADAILVSGEGVYW